MIIAVNHKINNLNDFWSHAEESLRHLPANGIQRIILVLPNYEMTEATCLWEADSIEKLDKFLRNTVGGLSVENYHEVNPDQALGLSSLLNDKSKSI